ncbi:dTDP-4-dehydrorhamnose reductase [Chromobacterium phragmitis]|uniref:dTDP-4-dehydrorhamnose reductase n=1 Tax=Chromobacterium phragmitis TaxID=2202141 RepID=UPI000DED2E3B|nr:dTDP-4-dehydrorhamnose reductase [Chromobacterium phragmitis]AXE30475.1 dTDP-4-dehydrorhamnose reductase [Chromobacterium phragmitis]
MDEALPRILITGKDGQVGHALQAALAPLGQLIAADRRQLDLSQTGRLSQALDRIRPDIIVNPAAYTAVDKAESEPELAFQVNAEAPGELARWAASHDALMVHYSTDYVFSGQGNQPWREDDAPDPQSVYGRSKWQGERNVRAAGGRHLILRTSWVFGAHGANFLKTMLRLAAERDSLNVVDDQIGAPTSALLIADCTARLLSRYLDAPDAFACGTYHLAAQGETSWHGYARYLLSRAQALGLDLKLAPDAIQGIPSCDYPTPARRPANSRLDCGKLKQTFDLELPSWQAGVDPALAELARAMPRRHTEDGKGQP